MSKDPDHDRDRIRPSQGEGANKPGDEAINRQRVAREADKHRNPHDDPADKAAADRRYSAARDRVLARDEGDPPVDPDEVARRLKAAEDAATARADEVARRRREAEQEDD
jgi:hypothetical protein